jgi:diguanylate cyclase (GGDEF)-like protein
LPSGSRLSTKSENPVAGRIQPAHLTILALAVGAIVTCGVSLIPPLRFAYRAPELHVAFDTVEGLIALTAGYLVIGRLRERQLQRDALLTFALILIGLANLFLLAAPNSVLGLGSQAFPVWGSLIVRLVGSGTIALASFSGTTRIPERWSRGFRIPLAGAGVFVSALAMAFIASRSLTLGLSQSISPTTTDPLIAGDPPLLATQLLLVVFYGAASVGFTRSAQANPSDPFLRWLGPGTALASIARVNYFLFPSIYTEFIYVGDFLRLAFYLLLLLGASQEIGLYWRRLEADIAERDRLNEELEKLSLTDALTGLNNRRGFETLAEHELRLAARLKRPVALMFIDLNEMKTINDTHGHDAGDDALRDIAFILMETLRDSDVVARLGGDEFCALIVGGREESQKAAGRIHAHVDLSNRNASRPYRLSLSIGIAHRETGGSESLEALIEQADAEMYAAKSGGVQKPSLLLVDDDDSIRQLIELQLDENFDIAAASSATQALEMVQTQRPDVVILDYFLPDGAGSAVVQELRRLLGPKIPIVMLTAASDVDEAAILRAGADDYLEKPFKAEVLSARIERLLKASKRR